MSTASCSSIKAIAGSVGSSPAGSIISGRVCKPRRCAKKDTLHKYLADYQRYEAVACGFAGISIEKPPKEDIHKMAKKLNAVSLQFSGSNFGQGKSSDSRIGDPTAQEMGHE